MNTQRLYQQSFQVAPMRSLLVMLALAAVVSSVAIAQTYMGTVDASRGFTDRWFYLFKRMPDNQVVITDSTWIISNLIRFRYHVKDSAVYWIFQQPGKLPDTSVRLVKFTIADDRFDERQWLDFPVALYGGICDCEFIDDNDGREILQCPRSGLYIDLATMAIRRYSDR